MSSRIAVVIPACNEQERVATCIHSVANAVRELVRTDPAAAVAVVLAADSCTDRTAAVARRSWAAASADLGPGAWLDVVHGNWASAGGARGAAAERALKAGAQWLASTDADTRVSGHWLTYHLQRAEAGVDAVLGTVEPDPRECPEQVRRLWHREHELTEGHPYIHAANMGIRAAAFTAAGGFPPVGRGEDEALVRALRANGATVESTDRVRAVTSGRLRGRAQLGFAYHLRNLARQRQQPEGFADRGSSCCGGPVRD